MVSLNAMGYRPFSRLILPLKKSKSQVGHSTDRRAVRTGLAYQSLTFGKCRCLVGEARRWFGRIKRRIQGHRVYIDKAGWSLPPRIALETCLGNTGPRGCSKGTKKTKWPLPYLPSETISWELYRRRYICTFVPFKTKYEKSKTNYKINSWEERACVCRRVSRALVLYSHFHPRSFFFHVFFSLNKKINEDQYLEREKNLVEDQTRGDC